MQLSALVNIDHALIFTFGSKLSADVKDSLQFPIEVHKRLQES